MATNTYVGASGGDWFDPSNWSLNAVPLPGETVDLFGPNGPNVFPNVTAPPDPTSKTLSGLTIDVSGTNVETLGNDGQLYAPAFNLNAGQLGTTNAPVAIDATADSGTTDSAIISFTALDGSLTVASGQTLDVAANLDLFNGTGVTINGGVTVANGATLAFDSAESGAFVTIPPEPLTLNGQVSVDGGSLSIYSSNLGGSGSIDLSNGGKVSFGPNLDSNAVAALPIAFGPGGGTLDVSTFLAPYTGTIAGFGAGDTIIGNNILFRTDPLVATYADGVLTVTDQASPQFQQKFDIAGHYTSANFQLQENSNSYDIFYTPCFADGTSIATLAGDRPVESLSVGDTVRLHDGGTAQITWMGHRRQHGGQVVRIRAGALGDGLPRVDLILSSDHGLYLDGVLVQAGQLVDGDTILTEFRREVTFWHLELDRHAILLAEGAPAESYLDTGNRRQFANCALAYDPVAPGFHEPCAEMVFAGKRLDAIKSRLRRTACVD